MWIIKIHKNWKLTNLKEKLEFSEKKKNINIIYFKQETVEANNNLSCLMPHRLILNDKNVNNKTKNNNDNSNYNNDNNNDNFFFPGLDGQKNEVV